MSATVTIRFSPQAWIRDQAIEVDPDGPTTFAVPVGDAQDAEGDWLPDCSDESDDLRTHANSPDWIRNWRGPFSIAIERDSVSAAAKLETIAELAGSHVRLTWPAGMQWLGRVSVQDSDGLEVRLAARLLNDEVADVVLIEQLVDGRHVRVEAYPQ